MRERAKIPASRWRQPYTSGMPESYRLYRDEPGIVEAYWRTREPPDDVVNAALGKQCPDCNVAVQIAEHPELDGDWELLVAHDQTCPALRDMQDKGDDAERQAHE